MKLLVPLCSLLLTAFLPSPNVSAQECLDLNPKTAFENAAAVFIGKIVADVKVPAYLENRKLGEVGSIAGYRLSAEKSLKGAVRKNVTVFTNLKQSPFSYPFASGNLPDRNRTYLVYAHRDPAFGGVYIIPKCTGTQDVYGAGYYLAYFGIGERLKRITTRSLVKLPVPTESTRAFADFFQYTKKSKANIVDDKAAQTRWLSKAMRTALMEYAKRARTPEENPDYPRNDFFLGVWNPPTTYAIVDTRFYDYHNKENPGAKRVMIDVLYEWGHEETLDNQYPGVRNLRTYCLIFEDGTWKLDDIYGFNDEFTRAESLLQFFRTGR